MQARGVQVGLRRPHARGARAARGRRRLRGLALAGLIASAAAAAPGVGQAAARFGLSDVAERARRLAARPYSEPTRVPDWLVQLSYDQWRDIRFRPDAALWRAQGLPFSVQFFHPGLFYDRAVQVSSVDGRGPRPVAFSPSLFDYGKTGIGSRIPQDLGFAGFRVHHPIKRPDYHDEVIVFLGATYFRAVGRENQYGLSARGLAIDTALPSGEEFPWFREFWLEQPAKPDSRLTFYALLDSPGAAGAYRFVVTPGSETRVDVDLQLFARRAIAKLGIAPLTSMFLRGENSASGQHDYRPEVHDSDGLLVETGQGEWIWRPLDNPETLNVTSFQVEALRGFGLLQRDRNFDHYQDLEARPEQRPSAWVTPRGDWGRGRVELVEIPTHDDANDNVVVAFVPEQAPPPEQSFALSYTLAWYGDDPARPPGGRVVSTRRDRGGLEDADRFVIDFAGGALGKLPAETVLRGVVTAGLGSDAPPILDQQVMQNPITGGWRLVFQVRPEAAEPLELRAFLQHGEEALTETWSYLLRP
jgi:glucans biosynthesis protein